MFSRILSLFFFCLCLSVAGEDASDRACGIQLRKLCLAFHAYADSFRSFPKSSGAAALDDLCKNQCADASLFVCPGGKRPIPEKGKVLTLNQVDYLYFGNLAEDGTPSRPLLLERPGAHGTGFALLRINGKVDRCEKSFATCEEELRFAYEKTPLPEKYYSQAREYDRELNLSVKK